MSFAKAGLKIPKYFEKHLVARVCLLKSFFTKLSEDRVVPTWGQILIKALRFIGFNSPTILFRSLGSADIKFIVKHLKALGLYTLSGLFKSVDLINTILEQKRRGQERKQQEPAVSDQSCLVVRDTATNQPRRGYEIGFKDKFGLFRNVPDPPKFRSISMVGNLDDETLISRNKQSLYAVWKNLQPDGRVPRMELSARNVQEMAVWVLNCAASPNCLLDANNQISTVPRIIPLTQASSSQYHIFRTLAEQAKIFCKNLANKTGPSSPIHEPNILTA